MNEFSTFVKATLAMYGDAARKATQDSARAWPIFVGSIVLYLIYFAVGILVTPLGGLGAGFILGILICILLSMYYSWIRAAADRERIRFADLREIDWGLFSAIISVGFILWIVVWAVRMLTTGLPQASFALLGTTLLLSLLFNPAAETVYRRGYESVAALKHSYQFVQQNWIEWYIPFLVLMTPILLVDSESVIALIATGDPLMPALPVVQMGAFLPLPIVVLPIIGVFPLGLLVGVVLAGWYMLFRAHLFDALESGSRRRRIFEMRQR